MNIYELIDKMALEHKSIFDMPLRVTFYARVSTKSDEQLNSQENQIQTFTDLIKRNSKWILNGKARNPIGFRQWVVHMKLQS